MNALPYNIGPETVTVYVDRKPHTVARSAPLLDAIRAGDWDAVRDLVKPAAALGRALASFGDVQVMEGSVLFRGRPINNASVRRILELQADGLPIESEARCLASLMRHDDPRVIENFEDFLSRWNVPRTSDGRIVLCKAVRDDYRDLHSGKVDWSPGNTVRMEWHAVDRDPSQTCSRGLHAAPLEGAQDYMRGGARLIELYVSPEHIAALPYDYKSCGKIRVVQAYVAGDIPDDVAAQYYSLRGPVIALDDESGAESDGFTNDWPD